MSSESLIHDLLPLAMQYQASRAVAARLSAGSDAAEVLRLEPVLAARVLRAANSQRDGLPRCVGNLPAAVAVLPVLRLNRIVRSAMAVAAPVEDDPPLEINRFWRHSLVVGRTAEAIARHMVRREPIDPSELYCSGLLHDIGRLWLCGARPASVRDAVKDSRSTSRAMASVEDPALSHTAAGEALCLRWNLPAAITSAVAHHHHPLAAGVFSRASAVVHIADVMAHIAGADTVAGETVPELSGDAVAAIGIPPETLRVIAYDVLSEQKKLEAGLGLLF